MPGLNLSPIRQGRLPRIVEGAAIGAGILVLLATVYASWSPPGLRPVTNFSVGWEHIAAFGLIGASWGFAFPRRALQVVLVIVVIALILEAGQMVVPGRHARLIDVATKIAGGGAGVILGHLVRRMLLWVATQASR